MKKLNIAFFPLPFDAHVNATLNIALPLIERGHQVTYAAPVHFEKRISEIGARTIKYKQQLLAITDQNPISPNDPKAYELLLSHGAQFHTLNALNIIPQIISSFEKARPDAIIYDFPDYVGRMLARIWQIPAIQACPYLAPYNDYFSLTGIPWCKPKPSMELCKRLDEFIRNFFPAEQLNLFLIPPELQPNLERFDDRFHFIGPCAPRASMTDFLGLSRKGKKIILFSSSASSAYDESYFQLAIDAFKATDFHVVLSTGRGKNPSFAEGMPDNFTINQFIPQRELLPFVSIFIGGGGMVSMGEALQHGVPSIAIPPAFSHVESAYHLEQQGLGIALARSDITPPLLRNSVITLLNDQAVHRRIKRLQSSIEAFDGPTVAADKIEAYLTDSAT